MNATQAPWNEHYKMYDYIRNELPDLVMQHFPATTRKVYLWSFYGRAGRAGAGVT
ncbi:alpha/beta hydrolase-fold protein [Escherichia coli]